ncbi:MAG: tRNA lysidine(34) synthetase TilS [Verrucomicrobiota bacterium]
MPPTNELNDAFAASLEDWMPKSASYLVAVSGGLDSIVLLHFLNGAGYRSLTVFHVNHQLRGEAAELDAELVSDTAGALDYECVSVGVEVAKYAEEKKCSIELAARELRYRRLQEIGMERDCPRAITAHHADDQVETVLINFFRGTGSKGIRGMEALSTRTRKEGDCLSLYRPFLSVRRSALERFAEENRIEFRQDESNFDDFALRNRIRNILIPKLNEVFERDISTAVLRVAELAARDEEWIASSEKGFPRKENGLDVTALREMPRAMRDRILLRWLRDEEVPDCGYDEIERVNEILLRDENPSKGNLPGRHHVRRRAGILFLEKEGESAS